MSAVVSFPKRWTINPFVEREVVPFFWTRSLHS